MMAGIPFKFFIVNPNRLAGGDILSLMPNKSFRAYRGEEEILLMHGIIGGNRPKKSVIEEVTIAGDKNYLVQEPRRQRSTLPGCFF
jgi:hypothetical protein